MSTMALVVMWFASLSLATGSVEIGAGGNMLSLTHGLLPEEVTSALPPWPTATDRITACPALPPFSPIPQQTKTKKKKKKNGAGAEESSAGPVTHADELAYVAFNVSSKALLKTAVAFWTTAGLREYKRVGGGKRLRVLMRGYGPGSQAVELRLALDMPGTGVALAALGFYVTERRYVHDLARHFYDGRTTEKHKDGRAVRKGITAGGEQTVVYDPDGVAVEVTFDARGAEQLDIREMPPQNGAQWKGRAANVARPRVAAEEQEVQAWRLGYVTLRPRNVSATVAFYQDTLGFVPTDVLVLPAAMAAISGVEGDTPVLTHLRLSRSDGEGTLPSDHHTLVVDGGFSGAGDSSFVGAAFEVDTIDAVAGAHRAVATAAGDGTFAAAAHALWAPARRTFGSAFAHSALLSDAEGARWAGLSGFGVISHFTDMDLVEGGDDEAWAGSACHVFNGSGQVQWGGAPYAALYWQYGPGAAALMSGQTDSRNLALAAAMLH